MFLTLLTDYPQTLLHSPPQYARVRKLHKVPLFFGITVFTSISAHVKEHLEIGYSLAANVVED